jgi:hypothetical protein
VTVVVASLLETIEDVERSAQSMSVIADETRIRVDSVVGVGSGCGEHQQAA